MIVAYSIKSFCIKGAILCLQGVLIKYGWDSNYMQEVFNFYGAKIFINTYIDCTLLSNIANSDTVQVIRRNINAERSYGLLQGPKEEVFGVTRQSLERHISKEVITTPIIQNNYIQHICFNLPRIIGIIGCGLVIGASAAILATMRSFA